MHDAALDDSVSDRLSNNVLGVLLRVKVKLDTDVSERDPRVGQREPSDPSLDNILPQSHDEGVRLVRLKLRGVAREGALEL